MAILFYCHSARQLVIFNPVHANISSREKLNTIYYISSTDSETRQFSFSWGKWPSFQNNKFTLVSPSRDLVFCAEDRCDNAEHDRPQRGRISCNGRAERFMTRGDPARKHLLPARLNKLIQILAIAPTNVTTLRFWLYLLGIVILNR